MRTSGSGASAGAWAWCVGLPAAGLLAVAALHASGTSRTRAAIGVQAVARWALLPAHLLTVVAVRRRSPGAAALCAGLAGYQVALSTAARGGRTDRTPGAGVAVRLVSANLLVSNPSIAAAAARLLATPVDVLALQELTPDHLSALRRTGLLDQLPHELVAPEPGFHGAGLFSRWPLTEAEVVDLDGVPLPVATITTPDGPLRMVVVHAKNPGARGELRRWQRQLAALATLAAGSTVPVVLVGDYNATADHRDFRRLCRSGLRDAWDLAGAGSGASWPVWRGPVPPLLRLDHALIGRGLAVSRATAHDLPGSDHRHLRVELRFAPV